MFNQSFYAIQTRTLPISLRYASQENMKITGVFLICVIARPHSPNMTVYWICPNQYYCV